VRRKHERIASQPHERISQEEKTRFRHKILRVITLSDPKVEKLLLHIREEIR